MKTLKYPFIILLLITSACGNNSTDSETTALEAVINAPSSVSTATLITLDGSESTGPITAYGWLMVSQPSGSAARIRDSESAQARFAADSAGNYTIRLIVSSDQTLADSEEITITASDD